MSDEDEANFAMDYEDYADDDSDNVSEQSDIPSDVRVSKSAVLKCVCAA